MPLAYATPEDVARLLDDPPDQISSGRRDEYRARLLRASQKWDQTTGEPMRSVRDSRPADRAGRGLSDTGA